MDDAEPASEEGYAFRDLVVLRAIVSLVDKGIPLQRIRRNLELLRDRLPDLDDPAAALQVWDDASRRLVIRHDGRLEEAAGQLLLEFDAEESAEDEAEVASLAAFEAAGREPIDPREEAVESVSYTHLTLPTICSV